MPKQADTAHKTEAEPAASATAAANAPGDPAAGWSVRAFNGPDLDEAAATGQRSLAAMAHLHSRVFRDALRFNAELLDFASRRVRADIEASNRLARCESVTEAMDVMSDFYHGVLHDYTEESTALVRLGSVMSAESTEEAIAEAARLNERKAD